jgi:hypothetical protein
LRRLGIGITIGLLVAAAGVGTQVQHANAAGATQAKVVIVVGATQGMTDQYRSMADAAAGVASKYTSNVVKVYSPNATWEAVQSAAQGAGILIYLGHGSGYPNPYVSYPQPNGDNGMGLNATAGSGDDNTKYYGENYMASLGLASNAVVILNHLCYASGNSEWGQGLPSLDTAQTRVEGYASGFLRGNARAVIAEGMGDIGSYITAILTTDQPIDQMWKSSRGFNNHVTAWSSSRNAGFTAQIDPSLDHPAADGDYYYRSMVSLPGLTTDQVGQVSTWAATTYHPVAPTRILDSRDGTGGLSGAFSSHQSRTFQVTSATGPIPTSATAVTGNLTVTQQTSLGFLYLGPDPMDYPSSSTLNFPTNDDRANGVFVALGTGGTLSVTYAAPTLGPTAHVIFDVTGYFAPPDETGLKYVAVTPTRLLDTRDGTGGLSGPFANRAARTFAVVGGAVPATATAVTGNLTVTQQTGNGFLYIGPAPADNPTSSSLNFPVGDDRANGVAVALGSGSLSITFASPVAGATAHVIFDVTGYFTADGSGDAFVPLTPTRILDSRGGPGLLGAFSSHSPRLLQVGGQGGVPASGASAITANLTVTQQTGIGYLYIGPSAMADPTSSSLNFPLGDDRANLVAVALTSGGTVSITYAAPSTGPTAHVVLDVTGYFAP